jgi:hypothetical protein
MPTAAESSLISATLEEWTELGPHEVQSDTDGSVGW